MEVLYGLMITVELVSINSNNLTILANKLTESENNIVRFSNKVAADTISKYNQLKQEFDNNKFNQNITNIHLDEMFTNGLREMKEYNKSLRGFIVQYIIAILLQSKLIDNKEKDMRCIIDLRLLYPNLSTVNEQYINEKIRDNNKFNNNINNIKDIRNYYETETNNYKRKLSRYKNYINIAEITEIVLSSIATTTSVSLTGIGLAYSITIAFATATVCGSLSKKN